MTAARRGMLRMAVGLVVVYVVYGGLMYALQRWFLFPRHATSPNPDTARQVSGLTQLWVDSPAGRVEGWLLVGDGVSASSPGPAVIFTHGNAELIEHWPQEMQPYRQLGISVLLAEYRGYGRSAGSPSEAAITEDMVAFYDQLIRRPEVDKTRIIFHGRSLGGGAACALAVRRPPRAMILQSTFTSIRDMVGRFGLPGFLVADPFDNLAVVKNYRQPLLLVHGRRDEVIPYSHAERLKQAAPHSKLVTYDAGHNDCPPQWRPFWREVGTFLSEAKIL